MPSQGHMQSHKKRKSLYQTMNHKFKSYGLMETRKEEQGWYGLESYVVLGDP